MGKLFGPSLNELAKKETQLRRKESGKRIIDNPTTHNVVNKIEKKKPLSFNQIIGLISIVVIASVIFIGIAYTLVSTMLSPKPDYVSFSNDVPLYLDTISDVSAYRIDKDIVYVSVLDTWFNSSDIEKARFCTDIRDSLTVLGLKYNIVKDNYIYTVFVDSENITVAEPDWGSFKILY